MHVNLNWAEFLSSIEYPVKCKQKSKCKNQGSRRGARGTVAPYFSSRGQHPSTFVQLTA